MKKSIRAAGFLALSLSGISLAAQVCDPSMAPMGLTSTYTPGSGALLEWDAVPGSIGVQLQIDLPLGSTLSRRMVGFEQDQFAVPDVFLSPGTYTWRVQAACSTTPPYDVTPISASTSFAVGGGSSCPSTVTDIDGNVYNTVEIGSQCWMKENLKVEHFNNGDSIPTSLSSTAWSATTIGAFSIYDNIDFNRVTYGLLYNWFPVVDTRGLCPVGWHVPTDAEWTEMITLLDPTTCGSCFGETHSHFAGGLMKSTGTLSTGTGLWWAPNTGATNSSGFSGIPGGARSNMGLFYNQGFGGYWWSSSESAAFGGWFRVLVHEYANATRASFTKRDGLSVRCILD
ncbi:MAG: hypothetical protein GC205_11590 [Bacteroidetes bacterium]|nr:hypothetical protein [Bacteroidota bacterium]